MFKQVLLAFAIIAVFFGAASPVASAATSDINNDGRDDIVSLYDYGNANTGVFVFKSTGTAFDLALPWRSGPGNWEWSRTKLATGDFDGDFDADVFALYDYGNADTGVFVFKSNGTTFDLAMPWRSGPGNWEWGRTKIVAGDFDGDNRDDIMALYDYGNANMGVFVFKSNGTTFDLVMPWRSGPGNWELSRTKLSAGDFNNDNRDDIMALYDYGNANTGVFVFKSTGTAFDLAKPWSSGPGNWEWGRTKMVAGDFDGDNLADISALYDYGNANTGMFLFKSNGVNAFTESRSYLSGPGNLEAGRCKLTSGDFAPTVGKEAAILYDYGNANMGVFVFAHAGASSTITPFWFSGPGNWEWMRTTLAGGENGATGFDPLEYTIGVSFLGSPITVTKIGNGSRRYLFIGGHHGNEPQGSYLLARFREYLLTHPAEIPPDAEVWIITSLNPDGINAGTRWNARGVNLNRNYWTNDWGLYDVTAVSPIEAAGLAPMTDMSATITGVPYTFNYPGPWPFSESETTAVKNLCETTKFRAMISIHDAEGRVYWGQSGVDMAYLFASYAGLPVAGPLSISGDATRWFGQTTGCPSITVELTDAQATANPADVFAAYRYPLLVVLGY